MVRKRKRLATFTTIVHSDRHFAEPFIVPQVQHKADPRRSSPRKRSRQDRFLRAAGGRGLVFNPRRWSRIT